MSVRVCRDHGQRVADRQKTRLMWMVEDMGAQKFRETVSSYIGYELKTGKHIKVCNMPHGTDIFFCVHSGVIKLKITACSRNVLPA